VAVGEVYLRIAAFVFAAYVILYINVSALQGLRRPMFALGLGLFRQIAAPAVAFYLLAYVLGMGLAGIWWGILGVTWCAALVSLAFTRWTVRGLAGEKPVV
jgi:Na+-driven multidrug efflux pump